MQKTFFRPKKSSFVSGNRPGRNLFIIYPPALSNVYQNIYLSLKKQSNKNKRTKSKKKTKEENRTSVENLTRQDNIVSEFALYAFNLLDQVVIFLLIVHMKV